MEHNAATQGIETKILINLSNIDKNINDNDLVYIDNRSLKVVLPDKENIDQIQEPLRQQLQESLNNAGRKSLAERSVKQPITYKTFNFLISQINSPRTTRTLLDNINKQFSCSIEDLPEFVRQDMRNKRLIQLPKNIHILYCLASLFPAEKLPLTLIKHITTQCLEIDFDSPFDTLEEERLECILMLVNSCSNIEYLKITTNCIATLSGLENILKHQNKENWEQLTLQQPAKLTCLEHLLEEHLIVQSTSLHGAKTDEEPSDAPYFEPLHSDKKSSIAEESTEETPSHSDKTKSKDTSLQTPKSQNTATKSLPKPAISKQTLSESSQEARQREISKTLPNPQQKDTKIQDKIDDTQTDLLTTYQKNIKQPVHEPTIIPPCEPSNLDQESPITEEATAEAPTAPSNKAQSKDTLQPLPNNPALAKQTSSEQSQEASCQNIIEILANPQQKGTIIENQDSFNMLIAFYVKRLYKNYDKRKTKIETFIEQAESGNQALYQDAKDAFNSGFWIADQLSDLLTKASLVSTNDFFKKRLSHLIKKEYLSNGYPPHNKERKKTYMKTNNTTNNKPHEIYLNYTITQDTTPSEALYSCCRDFWIADQGTIIEFVYALTLHLFWGTTIFDSYFAENPFSLCSFSRAHATNNPICALMKNINKSKCYNIGVMYPFHNYSKYSTKHPSGNYKFLYTFCAHPSKATFSSIAFFNDATKDTVHDTLVSLYNKESLRKEITEDEQSQEPLKECDPKENYPLSISKHDLLGKLSSKEVAVIHTLNYGKALEEKQNYIRRFKQASKIEGMKKEPEPEPEPEPQEHKRTKKKTFYIKRYPDYSDSSIDNNTAEATQASPFLRPETPKTEKTLEDDQKRTLSTLINHVNKTLKEYHLGIKTKEKLCEAFLPFKVFYLELKESSVSLYNAYNDLYKKLETSVQRCQECDL